MDSRLRGNDAPPDEGDRSTGAARLHRGQCRSWA